MTDQPKPRGPLSDEERKHFKRYDPQSTSPFSDHTGMTDLVLDLDIALRNALAEADALKTKASFMEEQFKAKAMRNGENVIARDKATHHAGTWLNATADARTEIVALKAEVERLKTAPFGQRAQHNQHLEDKLRLRDQLAEKDAEVKKLKAFLSPAGEQKYLLLDQRDTLKAKLAAAVGSLELYGNKRSYEIKLNAHGAQKPSSVRQDRGKKAREALAKIRQET